ncbi:MAG: hypothetical protein ACK41C_00680 [Phenylobacterium sp.]|uniref:hypothetical protein n=1 Tax=Phenylobacterium sp. TaxID=1871053 RepID=UPI00391CF66D
MAADYGPFARPNFTAADFDRPDDTGTFDMPARTRPPHEPRSFRPPEAAAPPAPSFQGLGRDPVLERQDDELLLDDPAPPVRTREPRASAGRRSVPVAALVGVPALVLAAGVGYLALTGGEEAVIPAKAPGEPTAEPFRLASAETSPVLEEADPVAEAEPAPAEAAPPPEPRAPARREIARAAPAPVAAASAADTGVEASAVLPEAPQPYSAVAQTPSAAAPMIAPPSLTPPPITSAPATPTPIPAPAPATEIEPNP